MRTSVSRTCDWSPCSARGGGDVLMGLSAQPSDYQLLSVLGNCCSHCPLHKPSLPTARWCFIFCLCLIGCVRASLCASVSVCLRLCMPPSLCVSLVRAGCGFNNMSQISMARHKPSGRLLTVKTTNLDECTEDELLQLMNEVLLSRRLRHPNLLTSRMVFCFCCQLWVLSPLMSYGSADFLLRSYFPDGMSESLIAYLLHGVLKALHYLHHMGYVHRGVKASHILLSAEGRVCLSGLHGVYSLMKDGKRMRAAFDMPQHSPALLPWLSPELLRQDLRGYGVKSDLYSVGILVCELVRGRVPFQDMPPTLMLLQKLRGSHSCLLDVAPYTLGELGALKVSRSGVDSGIGESVAAGSLTRAATAERPQSPGPKNHSPTLHNLLHLCLQHQPERRPSATCLLAHPFFKQVKKYNQESFLTMMYPAVPLSCPPDSPISELPTHGCNSPLPDCPNPATPEPDSPEPAEGVWDFS
ncbi:STE20-related kinase adapter protein beta isoform X3 [Brachyhypopomus gauderio]|uniref:STE20-related kinase adapter protein beta isoform X3 n=1 Tax=Brachyhypopomus gauderio TaxID=698409 RepID=UPI00404237A1